MSPGDPTGQPFLIDAMVFPGNSGGPVFRQPTGVDRLGNMNVGGRVSFLGAGSNQGCGRKGEFLCEPV